MQADGYWQLESEGGLELAGFGVSARFANRSLRGIMRRREAIFMLAGASALAVKAATSAIPIVFEMGADPVASGVVASLDRPGGNLTGVISLNAQVGPKRLELLHELFAAATTFALLVNPTKPRNAEASSKIRGRSLKA